MSTPYLFQSQRLGFRTWETADVPPFAQLNQDPAVTEFLGKSWTPTETQGFVDKIEHKFQEYGYGPYAVDVLQSSTFIGVIGFWHPTFDAAFTPCVEILWRLKRTAWGQGFATEGAQACLRHGFEQLGLKEVYSFTATLNHRSERVMQKAGMSKLGEFDHPKLEKNHPLCRHVLYRIKT